MVGFHSKKSEIIFIEDNFTFFIKRPLLYNRPLKKSIANVYIKMIDCLAGIS